MPCDCSQLPIGQAFFDLTGIQNDWQNLDQEDFWCNTNPVLDFDRPACKAYRVVDPIFPDQNKDASPSLK